MSPPKSAIPAGFGAVDNDKFTREKMLDEIQRFRGRVYLEEGAVRASELDAGRHRAEEDARSWHLLVMDESDRICGCVRHHICPNGVSFSQLSAAHSALAQSPDWGRKLKEAVESELAFARRMNLPCVEVGGWALAPEIRGTSEGIRMALAMFSAAQQLGGSIGISTVTRRHCSASILRRIGGRSFEHEGGELPAYEDPQFGCVMELLRFYSWAPNPRYKLWIEAIKEELRTVPVLTGGLQSEAEIAPGDLAWPALAVSNAGAMA